MPLEKIDAEAQEIIDSGPVTSAPARDLGTKTDPHTAGNADEYQPPDGVQQPDARKENQDKTSGPQATAPDGKPAGNADGEGPGSDGDPKPPTADDVRKVLGLEGKESETLEHWKTRYSESSKEAKERTRQVQLLTKRLEEQGFQTVFGDEDADLVATDKYQPSVKVDPKKIVDSLTKDEQELYVDDPEKYATAIIDKVLKATARPAPTRERSEISISQNEQKSVVAGFSEIKNAEGIPKYPDFGLIQEWIDPLLSTAPEAFQKFATASKDNFQFAVDMLYQSAAYKLQPFLAKAKDATAQRAKKKDAAESDPSLTSEGTIAGKARQPSTEDNERNAIVGAIRNWT